MSFSKTLFVAVDKLFDGQQNGRKETKFDDVKFDIQLDVPYSENEACKLDTYCVPELKQGKFPVLFLIHGGGFVAGDKHHRRALSRWSAVKGYFVVNVNYGLCPDYVFPTPLVHLVTALNWVEKNAEKYDLDLDKMIAMGDSAGGYFAAMLAGICTNKPLQERLKVSTDAKFAGAILNCGIYDVGAALNAKIVFDMGTKILKDFAGVTKAEFENYEWKDICAPIDFVNADFPKTFLTYAGKDFFCGGQGPKMIDKLKEKGVYTEEYHSIKFKNNHCFSLGWRGAVPEENNALTASFMERFKKGEI